METNLEQQLIELKKSYNRFKRTIIGTSILAFICYVTLSFTKINKLHIITAKGIVIEEAKGKDRILIGAPNSPIKR